VPAPLFLLNPKNEAFVNGRTKIPENENPLPLLGLKLLGVSLTIAFAGYWLFRFLSLVGDGRTAPVWPILMAAFLGALIVFVVYWTLVPILRNRRFQRPCRLVYGELIACKRIEDDETVNWLLTYRFRSPSGAMVEGKWNTEGTMAHVSERPAPSPGAPVAVAYVDDRTHRLL
jgi:hypothetical protein